MTPPRWDLASELLGSLRAERAELDAEARADYERFGVLLRDELAAYGMSLDDEAAVYHGLAFMAVALDLARNSHANEAIDQQTLAAVAGLARSIAMALAERAP
ncbi:hypothetical protein BH20ACT2_BH20ACT2_09670 [soil metagenome]